MFARSTTITGADTSTLDQGIAYVRDEVMPELMELGCVGLSILVDRLAGDVIATSSWETLEARDATLDAIAPYRTKAVEIFDGVMSISEWEVALMHRDHDAFDKAACRVTWARTSDVDGLVDRFRDMVLPTMSEAIGFCSASLFVDRELGAICGTTTFDSRATLVASRARADANRGRAKDVSDILFTDVREFDLVLAHLRLPELV